MVEGDIERPELPAQVDLHDGRTLRGELYCFDFEGNIILQEAHLLPSGIGTD